MKQKGFVSYILLVLMSFVLCACGVTTPATPDTMLTSPALKQGPGLSGLKVLVTIGGGSDLVPAFSPDITEYALSINSEITGIGVVPSLPDQSNDNITIDGNITETGTTVTIMPAVGTSNIKVVVNALNGKNTTYTITVHREDIQPFVNKFLKLTFTDPATRIDMGYRLFIPENYDPKRSYPLVVFLHGAGETGSDNEIQIANQGATVWSRPEEQAKHPSFVLAPQSNMDPSADKTLNRYGNIGWTSLMRYGLAKPFESEDQLVTAYDILQKVKGEYNIDRKRIYLTGLSMGGFGVFSLAVGHPDEFAALVPICGGGDPAKLASISMTPIWIFHAQEDPTIPVQMSRDSVKALEDAGGTPKYAEYPASTYFFPTAHFSWIPSYANTEMRDWLFQQSK